jgi:hypothetical protein
MMMMMMMTTTTTTVIARYVELDVMQWGSRF